MRFGRDMTGWLVYSPAGYALNRWFADRLLTCAAAAGLALELKLLSESDSLSPDGLPNFAVMRTIRPDLSAQLEARGVRVFNNAETARVANDKWETFLLAQALGLPVLKTVRFTWPERPSLDYPCVIKSLDGHGGSEVFLVRNDVEMDQAVCQAGKQTFVAQPLCDEPGLDLRVYVLGGEPVAAIRRTSQTDFRSNFKLGGEAVAVALPPELRATTRLLFDRLGFDFAGIDFIRHEGGWVLNEIEDVVGTRMLYATTDLDAAHLLIRHVAHVLLKDQP